MFCVSISVGDFPIPLRDVVPAIFGAGTDDAEFIVHTLRLPRALTGVLVGAAFGVSGAIFQSLARNPLASPDIIGINAGASAGGGVRDRRARRSAPASRSARRARRRAASPPFAIYLLAYQQRRLAVPARPRRHRRRRDADERHVSTC